MGLRPTYRDEAHRRKRGARTRACRAETRLDFSRRLLADATVQAQAPRRVGMRCGAQRRMKIGGCANWRPKDTRLPWRPQLEREDFRGSLAARMSACATFHRTRPWRRAGFLPTCPSGK